jgi:hypothetical protein
MGALQIVLAIFGTLGVIGFTIWYAYSKRIVRNIDVPVNSPKVYNFAKSKFTDGYWSGTLIREKKNKNGTTLIEYAPDDVQQGEEIKMAEKQSIVVLNENIIRFAQGELSSRRQVILITSRSTLDFPKRMQKTFEYDFLSKEGQMAYLVERVGEMISSGDEAIAGIMKKYARGEATGNLFGQIEEELKKRQELRDLQEGKKDSSQ